MTEQLDPCRASPRPRPDTSLTHGLALLLLPLGACGPPASADPPAGYPYASAHADCAPWDGPAVTILLTTQAPDSIAVTGPYVSISVWRSATTLAGRTFAWPSDSQVGAATRCSSDAACEAARSGRVTFAPASPDTILGGTVVLRFAGADSILRGAFRALWRRTRVMCG